MKKILIVFLVIIFLLTGCNKKLDTKEIKGDILKVVNLYNLNIESNDIKSYW